MLEPSSEGKSRQQDSEVAGHQHTQEAESNENMLPPFFTLDSQDL